MQLLMRLPVEVQTPFGPSVEGASPDLLAELLVELEACVTAAGGTTSHLNRGLRRAEAESALATAGLPLPPELSTWFGWHNGEVWKDAWNPGPLALPASPLLTLDESLGMRAAEEPIGVPEWDWDPRWLRLTGEWKLGVAIRCITADDAPLARMIMDEMRAYVSDTQSQVVSLCTPITWWIEAIRAGYYTWDGRFWAVNTEALPPLQGAKRFWM